MNECAGNFAQTVAVTEVANKINALIEENRSLKASIDSLQQHLMAERDHAAKELIQTQYIRAANQELVMATFGARDSKAAADAINQRQTNFLSMLAHELRNPMAAIAIANNVLESFHLVHPSAAKLLAIIRRQIGHLVRLVDDLLDASRITTGKISVQTRLIYLADVIDSAMETAQPALSVRCQTATVSLPPSIMLLGDLVRLSQLFANLLINASKFSEPGSLIELSAVVTAQELEVRIKDNGKGIAPENQSEIFDLFAQGPEAVEHALAGGMGIGLTLVRTITSMHGGSVRVESKGVGYGSTFIVALPLPGAVEGNGNLQQARLDPGTPYLKRDSAT